MRHTGDQTGRISTAVALVVLLVAMLWIVALWLIREPIGGSDAVGKVAPTHQAVPQERLSGSETLQRNAIGAPSHQTAITGQTTMAGPPTTPGYFAVDPFAGGGPTPVYVPLQPAPPRAQVDGASEPEVR